MAASLLEDLQSASSKGQPACLLIKSTRDEDKGATAMTSMAVGSVARMLQDMPPVLQLDDPGQEGTVTIPALLDLLKQHRLHTQLPLVILLGPMQLEEKPLVVTSGLLTASELLKLMNRGLEEWHAAFGRRRPRQPAEDSQQASEAPKRQQQAGQQQKQQPSLSAGAAAPAQQQPGRDAAANSSTCAQRSAAAAAQAVADEPAPGPSSSGGGQTGAPAAGQAGLQPTPEAQSGDPGPSGPQPVLLQIRLTDGTALRMEATGTTSLAEVKAFVDQCRTDGRAPFLFVDNAGGRTFGSAHLGESLAELGLHGRCSLTLRTSLPLATGGPQGILSFLKVLPMLQSVKRFFGRLFARFGSSSSKRFAGCGQASSAGQPGDAQAGGRAVPSSSSLRRRQNRPSDGVLYDNGNGAVFESNDDH